MPRVGQCEPVMTAPEPSMYQSVRSPHPDFPPGRSIKSPSDISLQQPRATELHPATRPTHRHQLGGSEAQTLNV